MTLSRIPKKGSVYLYNVLLNARSNALYKGAKEDNLFIHEVSIRRGKAGRKLDIRARGRTSIRTTYRSSIKIVLRELSHGELYGLNVSGHCPPGLAAVTRKTLIESNANFNDVSKMTYITTARGRFEQRKLFKLQLRRSHRDICKKFNRRLANRVTKEMVIKEITKDYDKYAREKDAKEFDDRIAKREKVYNINSIDS